MKLKIKIPNCLFTFITMLVTGLLIQVSLVAQDSTGATATTTEKVKIKPVKNTFQSVWIIDNQTVMVPVKGTFEMDIMHRFGTVQKGYDDFWGFFAPSNIRLGVSYAPVNKLNIGIGLTKSNMLWDASAKYSIITQTKGRYPVSITYYGDVAYDTRKDADKSIFKYQSQRLLFFNQVIIARKITDKFSVQVAPSISHQNAVNGYYTKNDSTGTAKFSEMKHDHFALSVSARYKLTTVTSVMVNYDQPLTKHATNNPNPNLSFGVEFNTSNHSFQLFMGNYSLLNPQRNNLYNTNSPFAYTDVAGKKVSGGKFLIGFNITRLWNY
ncbi:DUF5777 family beta-barrel protein [Ferruginibacter paludis]|uniref:DUF5777 family beta-barrel protein n=1 Tax=Ferruginibacter paludis TaxID=1310417 RepID=UPI0025B30CA3|nr:DUF5777 family beta-barrel protein [Ferruginibacter paludis]MDN3659039.1 DUF5777 family beta-barrel protein [Ferruginibacter paludis]